MKKSLLAVAAIGAFASAAQAQSSVTVYGILDVGYIGGNASVQNSSKQSTGGYNSGVAKTTVSQFGASAEQTSRLGFKGVEDLGGGKSAFFTVEFALAPQDQTLSGNSLAGTGNNGLNNRQSFVGLKDNKIGQVAVGLQYTPVFNAQAVTDPGMNNNIVGNVIYPQNSGITASNGASKDVGLTNRTSNTLSFKTVDLSGFTVSGMATLNNKNSTETLAGALTTGGMVNASGWGLGADFTYNKFYINAAYQALKQTTASNTDVALWTNQQANGATTAPVAPVNLAINGTASNIQDNQWFVGATYDFGILKAYAQYINRKATSVINSSNYMSRSGEQIGVRSYITPTIEAWASGGLGRYTAYGANSPTANFNGWQLGSNYWLSKRTNLYAIYGQTITSTAGYTQPGTTTSSTIGGSANNYAIGVRHTF